MLLDTFDAGRSLPLVLVDGDEMVGRVNVNNIVRGVFLSASLGYWVDAAYGGAGLATSAGLAVVDLARDDLGLHRLEAGTLRAQPCARSACSSTPGSRPSASRRRYLSIAGEWQDHRLYQRILHD